MRFIRTASTRRLLATIGGLVAAIAAGTAIAVAAAGPGPVPPARPLAAALRDALTAKPVQGITAYVQFTNNLIGAQDFTSDARDPILQGATGRLWLSNDGRLRVELQSPNGDSQIVVDNGSFWISDPASQTVYEGTLPASGHSGSRGGGQSAIPSVAQIQSDLNRLMAHLDLSGAIPGDVAGQAAYTIRLSPRHDGGLLGSVQLAWDAVHGVPLSAAVYARGSSTPVLELTATKISYGPVSSSDLAITPPPGDKVVKVATPASGSSSSSSASASSSAAGAARSRARQPEVSGPAAVASHVPFTLADPATAAGLPRQSVRLLDWGGHPAALVTYGQGLGGIAVIEQSARQTGAGTGGQAPAIDTGGTNLSLPTVSIDGATAQELATPLGTVLRFTRGGVAYTVLGSVPAVAAEAAARSL